LGVPLLALLAACGLNDSRPDTVATVNAVSTRVQQTLIAAGTLPAPAITTVLIPSVTLARGPATEPTATLPPTPTQWVPPSATSVPPASPTPAGVARPNGAVVLATRRTSPPTLDGNLADWPPLTGRIEHVTFNAANWAGAGDLSGLYAVAWDEGYLYLAAQVMDDVHVQTQHGAQIFRGDSLELLLDVDLAGDFDDDALSADDYQLGFSPGALNGDTPEVYLWFPRDRAGAPPGVAMAAQAAGPGYTLEAALPWALFNVTPSVRQRFGFAISASDNDTPNTAEQQSMVSNVETRRLTNPMSWGTLELVNSR
jgi:hypothetical protein